MSLKGMMNWLESRFSGHWSCGRTKDDQRPRLCWSHLQTAQDARFLLSEIDRLRAELGKVQKEYIELALEVAMFNTADARKRLKESEFIPAELWEMRLK